MTSNPLVIYTEELRKATDNREAFLKGFEELVLEAYKEASGDREEVVGHREDGTLIMGTIVTPLAPFERAEEIWHEGPDEVRKSPNFPIIGRKRDHG